MLVVMMMLVMMMITILLLLMPPLMMILVMMVMKKKMMMLEMLAVMVDVVMVGPAPRCRARGNEYGIGSVLSSGWLGVVVVSREGQTPPSYHFYFNSFAGIFKY